MYKFQHRNNYPENLPLESYKCEYQARGYSYKKNKHFIYNCPSDATSKITTDFSNWAEGSKSYRTKGIFRDIYICNNCLKKVMQNNISITGISLIKR